jgi:hypothetical protein
MANNIINVPGMPKQFDKTIDKMVLEGYAKYPREYSKLAKVMTNVKGRQYTAAQITGLGAVREMVDGAGVEFDAIAEGHKKSIFFKQYGLGFQVTQQTLEDELFAMIMKAAGNLGEQHAFRTDLDFFTLFAYGNDAATVTAWDGKAPFANNHVTLKSGDTINNLGAADLSETSLQAAFNYYYSNLISEEGLPIDVNPDTLLVPSTQRWKALQLMNQITGVTVVEANGVTNNNDNTVKSGGGYLEAPYKVMTSRILSRLLAARGAGNLNSWFLIDSKKIETMLIWKRQFTRKQFVDDLTDNVVVKGTMRYGVGVMDYKPMYGSFA